MVLIALVLAGGSPPPVEAGRAGSRPGAASTSRPPRRAAGDARPAGRASTDARLTHLLRRRALREEPAVTSAVRTSVRQSGGALVDLDQRIKSSASLLGKVRRVRAEGEGGVRRAIGDVLRYKVILPFEGYELGRRRILGDLERRGFSVARSKDTWGTRYPGHNIKLRTRGGYTFEIQFQTEAAHEVNRRTHGLYQRLRESGGEEARDLERRIREMTGSVPIPEGAGGATGAR